MFGLVLFTSILAVYGLYMTCPMWLSFVREESVRRKLKKVIENENVRLAASWVAIISGLWNLFAPDFGAMNSPTILGALFPSVLLVVDGVIICPESIRLIRIPKRIQNRWLKRIESLAAAAGPVTIAAAILHALFSRSLFL